jgi:cell division protein FtsZ
MSTKEAAGNYLAVIKVVGVGGGAPTPSTGWWTPASRASSSSRSTGRPGADGLRRRREDPHRLGRHARSRAGWIRLSGRGRAGEPRAEEALKGADMIFITAGEGGGTGGAPVVAELGREIRRSRSGV